MLNSIAYAALATLALLVLLRLLWRTRSAVRTRLHARLKGYAAKPGLQSLTRHAVQAALALETLARWIIVLVLLNVYIPLVLNQFPDTQPLVRDLIKEALTALKTMGVGIVQFVPNLVFLTVLSVVTIHVMRLGNLFFEEVQAERLSIESFPAEWAEPTARLFRVLVFLTAIVVAYPYLPGSDSAAFKGLSVFVGLIISFGSGSAVSNAIAGLVVIYARAFRLGDQLKVGDHTGEVVERTLFLTRIRTDWNEIVTVPNATLLSGSIVNYSAQARDPGLIVHTKVSLGYEAPWRQVHELLIASALETKDIRAMPKPFVLQTALNDHHVSYELNAFTSRPQRLGEIQSRLHENIRDRLSAAGIQMTAPGYLNVARLTEKSAE